jgi:putative flippase GtrA
MKSMTSRFNLLENHLLKQIITFTGVGLIATFIHAFFFLLCLESTLTTPQTANFIAFLLAFIFSYWGQTNITFSSKKNQRNIKIFGKFVITATIGFLMNAVWVYITQSVLLINPQWAVLGIGLLTPAITFFFLSKWVYKEQK